MPKKFLAPAAFLLLIALAFAVFELTIVKNITVGGSQDCVENKTLEENLNAKGKNLILLSQKNVRESLKQKFKCLSEIKIDKNYPSSLKITVSAQKPVAKIEGTSLFLTESGLVVENVSGQKPVIFLPKNVSAPPGKTIEDQTVIFALNLIVGLEKSDFTPQTARIVEQDIAVYNPRDAVAVFSAKKDLSSQIDSLQQVLAKAKIDAAKISKIDLRFDKPVVVFK